SALPELNRIRHNSNPTPEFGYGNMLLPFKSLLHILDPILQLLAATIGQHLALLTRPCAQPAPPNARVKVALALLPRQSLRCALNTHLALLTGPPKGQRRMRV